MAIKVVVLTRDAEGKTSKTGCYLPAGTALANALTAADQFAGLIHPMMGGSIVGATVTFDATLTVNNAGRPVADSLNGRKGFFQFGTAGGFFTSLEVPTFL